MQYNVALKLKIKLVKQSLWLLFQIGHEAQKILRKQTVLSLRPVFARTFKLVAVVITDAINAASRSKLEYLVAIIYAECDPR